MGEAKAKSGEKCNDEEWCAALARHLSEANRPHIAPVVVHNFSLELPKPRVLGVAFKRNEADAGVFFNYCPFCGADISPHKRDV